MLADGRRRFSERRWAHLEPGWFAGGAGEDGERRLHLGAREGVALGEAMRPPREPGRV